MRKIISLLLIITMCLGLFGCGAKSPKDDVVILYTNDIHTYIDKPLSYDIIAGIRDELEKSYGEGNVLLADAGDHVQGTAYGSMDKGDTIITLMNTAGYDIATLGNHEFDYGMEKALANVKAADFPYISCNFYHEKDGVRGENVLEATHTVETAGGLKVAFVGITTPESFIKSTPAYFQDESGNYIYGISGSKDSEALISDVQTAIDSVKESADVVIALGHMGDDASSESCTSEDVIAGVSDLNAFIDGHSHSTVVGKEVADKNGESVILTQTGEYFDAIGMMVIDGETGAITTDLIGYNEITEAVKDENGEVMKDENGDDVTKVIGYELVSSLYTGAPWPVNSHVAAIKDAWMTDIDAKLGAKIGETHLTLDNYDADGNRLVRSQETNTGDFCADALYYLFDNMDIDVDVAIMNGGGIRNKAVTGELTYKIAKEIHTFGNVACLQTVTGQQLLDALEWGARSAGTGNENGEFLQVSGVTYKIDADWPESTQKDDMGVWIGAPTGGYRVHSVKVYNKETNAYEPLDLTAKYNLAGYNYTLRNLGGGFNMFSGVVNVLDYVMEDYMVLANYISAFEGGRVDATNSPLAAKYPGMLLDYSTVNGSGRIVIESTKES